MCGTCGCGTPTKKSHGDVNENHHQHDHHGHDHSHDSETRRISVELDLLARNNHLAEHNREAFKAQDLYAINLVSSPGAGKTTLLEAAIKVLAKQADIYVIEGDQQTSLDADRITAAGAKAKQINTGAMCHLDAHMVGHAAQELAPAGQGWLFIENVGNLVCPAAFDLGENMRLVLLSVTEGDDKPLKYPDMFASSDVVVISKTDLLPYVPFDMGKCRKAIALVSPKATTFELSSTSGEGMDEWIAWLTEERDRALQAQPDQSVA